MALVREIARSPLKDLTLVAYGGPDVGLLCAMGKVAKLVFGFVSLDLIPLDAHFRAARQQGRLTEVMELDEGMLQWGLRAAMIRVPFLPTRAGLGSDINVTQFDPFGPANPNRLDTVNGILPANVLIPGNPIDFNRVYAVSSDLAEVTILIFNPRILSSLS